MCRLAYIEHIAMGADYKQRQVVRKECGFAIIGPPFQKNVTPHVVSVSAHPNLRLFITHGGISSLMEASSLGVPVLGVPFFGDQYRNMVLLRHRGYALIEPIQTLTKQSFLKNAQTMLNDPR